MSTVMRIDLRGEAPYYTLTRDADRTVYVQSGTDGSYALAGYAYGTHATNALTEATAGFSGTGSVLGSLRSSIMGDLATLRQGVFNRIRGTNAGPLMVPRKAKLNLKKWEKMMAMVKPARGFPERQAEYRFIASLELTFAYAMQAAQQVVQDAIYNGADWLDVAGDYAYQAAKQKRGAMVIKACDAYNNALPLGSSWPRYDSFALGLEWGM